MFPKEVENLENLSLLVFVNAYKVIYVNQYIESVDQVNNMYGYYQLTTRSL